MKLMQWEIGNRSGRWQTRCLLGAVVVLLGLGMAPLDAGATMIDFRVTPFDGSANYQPSYTANVAGVGDVTLSAAPGNATLYWDATDGFGVRYSYENDEIEGLELLTLSFASPVTLNTLYLTDLFNEGYLETGSYSLDGGAWIGFSADASALPGSTNGEKTLAVAGSPQVSSVTFRAPGLTNCAVTGGGCENHEYSVAAVDVSVVSVPEPNTLLLMGTALIGLALGGRRRKR